MRSNGTGSCSTGRRAVAVPLLGRILMHQLPVDGGKDSLFALAEPGIGLGCLGDGHDGLPVHRVVRGVSEMPSQGVRRQAQDPLELGDSRRSGCGLAGEPLRYRRLGDSERGGEFPLGQAALRPGALERTSEARPLFSRCHVPVLSEAGAVAIRMPDRLITGRFSQDHNFLAVRELLFTYTTPEPGFARSSGPEGYCTEKDHDCHIV
jgi:hypothetical protein